MSKLFAAIAAGAFLALAAFLWRSARQPHPAPAPRPEADAKVRLLDEILASRNDNDPRLETEFEGLSPETKAALREKHGLLPRERRAERGMIVYLLGRNLRSSEDWEFFRAVVSEPPCLSLEDCGRASGGGAGDKVTLAYPALVALRQARRAAEEDPACRPQADQLLALAKRSPVDAVVRLADRLSAN